MWIGMRFRFDSSWKEDGCDGSIWYETLFSMLAAENVFLSLEGLLLLFTRIDVDCFAGGSMGASYAFHFDF